MHAEHNAPLVLITGASSGMGQALAHTCLQQGWRVAAVARRHDVLSAWARQLPAELTQGDDRLGLYAADVCDIASFAAAAQACIQTQGLPDLVIANAGISLGMDSAEQEDLHVLRRVLETNVTGMAITFQPFITAMKQRGHGTLVGIASVAGIRGLPGHAAYCASKAAVISYCESLRGELAGQGIAVLTLVPGYVSTPLTARNRYPMPFLMSAEDFARSALKHIQRGHAYVVIPWPMAVVARLLRMLPNRVFDRLLRGRPRKHRHNQ